MGSVPRSERAHRAADRLQYVIAGRLPWEGAWLNRHYLARGRARRERVVYVLDPLPTRPAARRRALDDLRRGDLGGVEPDGVTTVRLPELPLQRIGAVRAWNDRRGAALVRKRLEPGVPTAVVYLPRARLFPAGALGEAVSAYLCSDDFRFRPDGSRDEAFCEWEDRALAACDLVIGVSDAIRDGFAGRHDRARTVENGDDPGLFRPVDGPGPADVADLPRPRVGFVGSVRPPLIDLGLAARVADARPDWSFCFVGWHDDGDPDLEALRERPNVRLFGPRPREALAAYISAMDVMTCPYPKCRVTEVASPLKAYEAVGAGKPLVATHIPALNRHRPALRSEDSEAAYLAALDEVIADPPAVAADLAARCTWAARAAELRRHLAEAIGA